MNHLEAKKLVDSLLGMTPNLSILTRAVSVVETNPGYGAGWKGSGVGSFNWGAITGTYQGQSFQHNDSRYDPKSGKVVDYTTSFRKYPSHDAAAQDLASLLSNRYSAAVNAVPDWYKVADSLYGYYLGTKPRNEAVADYAKALINAAKTVSKATGEDYWPSQDNTFLYAFGGFVIASVVSLGYRLGQFGRKRR